MEVKKKTREFFVVQKFTSNKKITYFRNMYIDEFFVGILETKFGVRYVEIGLNLIKDL